MWTLLIITGAVLMFCNARFVFLELYILNITLLSAILAGNVCPLTLWEEKLRRNYNPSYTNDGSYLATYLNKIFKTNLTVRQINNVVAVAYTLIYASIARIFLASIGVRVL